MKVNKDSLRYLSITIIILFLFTTNLFAQDKPVIYLEWVDNPLETMVINWIEEAGASRTVEYRKRGSTDDWESKSASVSSLPNTSLRRYSEKITGLTPGTSYEFRIDGISGTRFFRTAPASIEEPIRFIVGGDITETRGDSEQRDELREVFESVTDIAAEYNPLFVVVGGDWVHHPNDDYPEPEDWFYLLGTWTEKLVTEEGGYFIPVFGSAGNHEVPDYGSSPEDAIFYHGFLSYPQEQWGEERGYGVVDFSDYLSIITLDTNLMHSVRSQNNWLRNTLQDRRNVSHVYPVYHVPGWPTARTMRDGTGLVDDIRNEWHPYFRNNNIRLVFEHHDHSFKRTYPFRCTTPINNPPDCTVDEENGVIYTGGGTWGSLVRDLHPNFTSGGDQWVHEVNELENNFVLMEISERRRTLRAVSLSRGVVDTFDEVIFLPAPEALNTTDIMPNSFVANWEAVPDTDHYRLDVSTNADFSTFVQGYNDERVEGTSHEVTNLVPGQTYYYRIRARTRPTVSDNSETIQLETIGVDPGQSSIIASSDQGQANNQDSVTITVTAREEGGETLRNVPVELRAIAGNLIADETTVITNSEGEAKFQVRNDRPESVTYGAVASGEQLQQTVTINFIPPAPVALSASNTETRQFVANWEMIEGAEKYKLDVATDSSFTELLADFQDRDVGNVTSFTVSDVSPGTDYYYRVRAIADGLIGADSDIISVTTFPDEPVAVEATNENALRFTANWQPAEGAKSYQIDVASDQEFENIISDYENFDIGDSNSVTITGLQLNTNYYYRVRSKSSHRLSDYSNTVQTTTLGIDQENSEISGSQLRVFADGNQQNQLKVILRSSDGRHLQGLNVDVTSNSETTQIEHVQDISNEDGEALFSVSNSTAEEVTYSVTANSIFVGDITLEFISDDGELTLGDNFPNPFSHETQIPITIPSPMDVEITVYNSLGNPVQTLVNEQLESGYYEISFQTSGLASGVYFYRLVTGETSKTKKMILIK